ncbi:MAG: HNH endonuclease family protein [Micrococcales bacterium]
MQKTKLTRSLTAWFKFFISSAIASSLVFSIAPADAASVTALAALKVIPVKTWASHTGYERSQFGEGWGDIGYCDTRNYILKRDLKNIVMRAGENCIVQSGRLNDPYTGRVINFVRGVKTSLAVQIDHVIALSNAWSTGAQKLSYSTRVQLANDPLELLAVDGPTNQSKSDSDAASWLPRAAYRCAYVARQIAVKRKYHLWVTSAEKYAMSTVLATCPGFKLP